MNRAGEALLERAEQLAALESCWSLVTSEHHGRIVVVGGESGAGKTALVRAFCDGRRATVPVLSGAADALHTARPLGPFQDIARAGGPLEQAIEQAVRPFEVVTAVLTELAGQLPAVLVLEDLHWADEASLDVLRLLARRLDAQPLLVIVTYRDDEVGSTHSLRLLLGELPASLSRVRVPPLSATAVAELAGPQGVDGAELYAKTSGNAFFVTEVLAASGDRIPESVRDAVLARVARLGPASHTALETVAVVPQQAELWLLDQVAPGSGDGLDPCISAGILQMSGDAVAFRHDLARLAIEESVPPGRRRALHARLVRALAHPPNGRPDAARLAHHADAASDGPAVVTYARQAATVAAAVSSHREAAGQYARMLRYAGYLDEAELAEVYAAHSRESYLADDGDTAIASAQAAADRHRALGNRLAEADAMLWLATVQRMDGRLGDAETSMTEALRILDAAPAGPGLARAYAAAALAAMSSGDIEEAVTAGDRAMRLADELADLPTYIHALITVATVQMEFAERFDEGRANMQRAIELATRESLHELVGRAYNNLAYEAFARYDLDLAESTVRAAVAHATAHGVDLWLRVALGSLAEVQLARGDWDDAADSARQVLARPGTAVPRMGPLTVIGLIRARRADPDPWGPLDDALDIAQGTGELQMIVPVAAARAEAAWLEGRPDGVLAESESAVRRAIAAGDAWALADLAHWRRLAGADDELPELRDSPRLLQLTGRPELAADRWSALGYPYEAALALAESGTEPALRQALTELQQLGATAAAAVVARRLRDRGARHIPRGPRPSTATNAAHLTRREVQVVTLVAAGLGNAEIAQRLFLSEKTVGHHVSAVLRKLGVASRANAASEAVRRGLVPAPK